MTGGFASDDAEAEFRKAAREFAARARATRSNGADSGAANDNRPRRGSVGDDALRLTEAGATAAFVARHRGELRYCHHTEGWYRWDGAVWRREETGLALDLALALCRDLALEADSDKVSAILARVSTAAAVERAGGAGASRLRRHFRGLGPRPVPARHAGRHVGPAHRRAAAGGARGLHHQDHRRRPRRRRPTARCGCGSWRRPPAATQS